MSRSDLIPQDEEERLNILYSYGILEKQTGTAFERICELAARILDAPIALVSLIDRDEQIHKACFGMQAGRTSREDAFCAHTILEKEIFVIEDARRHPHFRNNPGVLGEPNIVFYAGVPLFNNNGSGIGSLCIIDHKSRELTDDQKRNMIDLATLVEDEIKLHAKNKEAQEMEAMYRDLYDNAQDALTSLRKNLLSKVSHEFRTPLSGIVGLANILETGWEESSEEEIKDILTSISESSDRLEETIQKVCEITHLEFLADHTEAMEKTLDYDPYEVSELVTSIATMQSQKMDNEVELDLQVSECTIHRIPRKYLTKALAELINNALKFSDPDKKVLVRGELQGDGYQLKIINSGRGMSERDIAQVGAFMQFDRDQFEQQGMGLGLELARKIADYFGFEVQISKRGQSEVEVSVELPCAC